MTNGDFEKFVDENAKKLKEHKALNWKKEKDDWLQQLDKLYEQIKSFLGEFTAKKQITITLEDISITEEYIGRYKAQKMIISIGTKKVILIPIGTNLIGAKGRVDMEGDNGLIKIMLVNSKMKSLMDSIKITTRVVNQGAISGKISIGGVEDSQNKTLITWQWKFLTSPPTSKFLEFNESNFREALMDLSNG